MNPLTVLQRLDDERRTLAREGEHLEVLPQVTRLASADRTQHSVIYARLDEATADATIAEQVTHYHQHGQAFEWKVYRHDSPADLRERLAAAGFHVGPQEAVLTLDLQDPPVWIEQTDTSAVVRVDRLEQLPWFRSAAEKIWQKDWSFTTNELAAAIRAGSTDHRAYLAMHNGQPVSVARLYTHRNSHFGGLYGGGTIAAYRGRGFYRSLIAARARDAQQLGARYLIVDALPTSQPILERLGFTHLSDTWPCEWEPKSVVD